MTTTHDLVAFRGTRTRWVLALGALQIGVLAAGLVSAVTTGFVAFAALAAAWMFIAVRISRGVIGDRAGDDQARRAAGRLRQLVHADNTIPADVLTAFEVAQEHRRAALLLSGGAIPALALGTLVQGLGPWTFGVAVVYVVVGLGWAWTRRRSWADARALVDAWATKGTGD